MLINYLELNNFRQFTGKQRIEFPVNNDKKITFIMAESGFGKTTVIQCFQWILYGECKYKSPLNTDIENSLQTNEKTSIICSMNVSHGDKEYTITRKQVFVKLPSSVRSDGDSELTIDIKGHDGITEQKKGRDAFREIKDMMHQDLFPYFFLEGENLTKVGEQMSSGKSGNNTEFVKAIKGLLGFNYLYDAIKHLKKLCSDYQEDIARNTTDERIKEIIEQIQKNEKAIEKKKDDIIQYDKNIKYWDQEREKLSDTIQKNAVIGEKQNESRKLSSEITTLESQINDQKKALFKSFSSNGIYKVLSTLVPKAKETLENTDALNKGIPGMQVTAIEYMLKNKECVCGTKLIEGSQEWNKLQDWIRYLPPNNIGHNINDFKANIKVLEEKSKNFDKEYEQARKNLSNLIQQYNNKAKELEKLNEEIGDFSEDIATLKKKENEAISRMSSEKSNFDRVSVEIEKLEEENRKLTEEQNSYKTKDEKIKKLQSYLNEAEYLRDKIDKYCKNKENTKRLALEGVINDIFKDFYDEKIRFGIDQNYGVQIKVFDNELSEDFTSGGQDVAIALAFIGAIIKLNKEGSSFSGDENIEEEQNKELYPLVMDAPTSNFGMKQMESFSKIIPIITDQFIVFINDKDGPILREKLLDKISSEWKIEKLDTYHSIIQGGK